LFRPIKSKADGTLGYVRHSWDDRSLYQKIGNFFIGTAPMFFGAGLLFLLLRFSYPAAFGNVGDISMIPGALSAAFSNMFTLSSLRTGWTVIVALVAIFICPHMHMSWADVKGATSGAVTLIIVAVLLSLATAIIPANIVAATQSAMNTFVVYYSYALALGLIVSMIMTVCLGFISVIRGKGL
jgi:hypothetical protein